MSDYRITDALGFSRDVHGAHLQFMSEGDVADFFSVAMSQTSLAECRAAFGLPQVNWKNKDNSLCISGNCDKVKLRFKMQCPPFETCTATIIGVEIEAFISALDHLLNEISFQSMMTLRNRVMSAYDEIMRKQS